MGRINAVLDDEADYGFEGGPEYNTGIVDLENRFEERDSRWKYPKHKYSASFSNIKEDARDYFIQVFHACRGARHSFLFKDWNDYIVEAQTLQVNSGTRDKVQLYKVYTFGQAYTVRPIQAVNEAATVIYDNTGTPVEGVLDPLSGEFTPTADWGSGQHTWSGEFYVWVRFADDYSGMTINNWQDHTTDIDLVEDPLKITATNVPLSWEE